MRATILCLAIFLVFMAPFSLAAGSGGGGYARSTPSCTEDTWSCSEWGICQKDGTQSRTCVLSYDCPNVETPKPSETASCAYVSQLLSSLKCHNLATMKERIECRLSLSNSDLRKELQIAYLPEECRALGNEAKKEDCVLLYSKSQQCWSLPIGKQRDSCLKNVIGMKNSIEEKKSCGNPACLEAVKKRSYALIKFAFYDLEERAEGLYRKGIISKEKAAEVIASLEEKKISFNQSSSKEQRKQIILDTKRLWSDFVSGLGQAK